MNLQEVEEFTREFMWFNELPLVYRFTSWGVILLAAICVALLVFRFMSRSPRVTPIMLAGVMFLTVMLISLPGFFAVDWWEWSRFDQFQQRNIQSHINAGAEVVRTEMNRYTKYEFFRAGKSFAGMNRYPFRGSLSDGAPDAVIVAGLATVVVLALARKKRTCSVDKDEAADCCSH